MRDVNAKEGKVPAARGGKGEEEERWYWHTMQRKQMKSEVSDAFRVRKWVVLALLLGSAGCLVVVTTGVRWVWGQALRLGRRD